MMDAGRHPNITLLTCSEVEEISGYVGNFTARVRRRPRYVIEDKCTGCGECVNVCPVTVPSEFDMGLGDRRAIYRAFTQAIPPAFVIDKRDSPCKIACPAHIHVQGYVALIAEGKFQEALDLVREAVPFAGTLGRICDHPCEAVCKRGDVDEPLSICALKRFVYDACEGGALPEAAERVYEERVAVVGAGPAGLTAAYHLARMGYGVTVYEAREVAGGMLAVGIPEYRLPRAVLNHEVDVVRAVGVEILLGIPVGRDGGPSLESLRGEYGAVFLGVGAHQSRRLNIPGEGLRGVLHSTDFLRCLNLGEKVEVGRKVAVVGGGNAAIDAARCALRLGGEVTVVYRRSRAEMPAIEAEVEAAMEEGVQFQFLAAPTRVVEKRGRVGGLECIKMELGEPDESGRRRPVPVSGSEFVLEVDTVIVSIGQRPELEPLGGVEATDWGTIVADEETCATPLEGVFAGGDGVSGPASAIEAMAAGRRAAESIHRYLRGEDLREGRRFEWPRPEEIQVPIPRDVVYAGRECGCHLGVEERCATFEEVELGLTEGQAVAEAKRCLSCAVCSECLECVRVCEAQAIDHDMQEEVLELEVGNVILATGFDPFDARRSPQYGYGRYANVFTGLEVERMLSGSGPTGGNVVLRDGKTVPRSVAIIHCVGSRDQRYHEYCSRVCCMYSLKLAHLIKHKTEAEVYDFYIDMRTPGKMYEEFYHRLLEEGTHFVRGKVAQVTAATRMPEEEGKLVVQVEDTLLGRQRRISVDMVVLAVGLEPRRDSREVARLFGISCDGDGWFKEKHPKLDPVATMTDGVFIAGCAQGPRDVPDSVAQGSAAAARVLSLIGQGEVEVEAATAVVDEMMCVGCGQCIEACPYTAIEFLADRKVAHVVEVLCKGCGTCAAACPSKAVTLRHFTDRQLISEMLGAMYAMREEEEAAVV